MIEDRYPKAVKEQCLIDVVGSTLQIYYIEDEEIRCAMIMKWDAVPLNQI